LGQEMTIEELRAILLDKELLKDLPLSKTMINFMVALIEDQVKTKSKL
jgi:hypothetical protein